MQEGYRLTTESEMEIRSHEGLLRLHSIPRRDAVRQATDHLADEALNLGQREQSFSHSLYVPAVRYGSTCERSGCVRCAKLIRDEHAMAAIGGGGTTRDVLT